MNRKKHWAYGCLLLGAVLLAGCGTKEGYSKPSTSSDPTRPVLFNTVDQSMEKADKNSAALFAPDLYKDAMSDYKDAEEKHKKKKELADIEKKLNAAQANFDKASEIGEKGGAYFKSTKAARDDAMKVEAAKYGSENWLKAEDSFKDAIQYYRDGKNDKADENSKKAENLYRKAELSAIKYSYLGEIRKEIEKLKDMGNKNYAQKTLKRAEKLADDTASELDRKRYDNDTAKKIAEQAGYEVKHAKQINEEVGKLKASGGSYEDLILAEEGDLSKIASGIGLKPGYENGLALPVAAIAGAVEKQRGDLVRKTKENDQKDKLIAELKSQNAKYSKTGETLKDTLKTAEELERQKKMAEEALSKEKALQAEREKKLQSIRSILKPEEGKILLDGDNTIVRIYGLTFASGKSTIEPKFFGILTKVKEIYEKYDNCHLTVEGHTDAIGSAAANLKLSQDRAEAVKQYFLANSSLSPDRINAVGYGLSRPVAPNTKAERWKNRRIDVIITPPPAN